MYIFKYSICHSLFIFGLRFHIKAFLEMSLSVFVNSRHFCRKYINFIKLHVIYIFCPTVEVSISQLLLTYTGDNTNGALGN